MSHLRKILRAAVANFLIILGLFLLMEGFFSVWVVGRQLQQNKPIAERLYTQYDSELGWINKPDFVGTDVYGPGQNIHINPRSFRGEAVYPAQVPEGTIRLICSGDSFTFGYGVDDQQAWCALLGEGNALWETVNMGVGGYGLDQSYLWHKRGAADLGYDVHLFAPVVYDYERMRSDTFFGYGKPYLVTAGDRLSVENVPVPRRSYLLPWWTRNGRTLQQLRTVQFLQTWLRPSDREQPSANLHLDESQTQADITYILKDLQKLAGEKEALLVIVYLPVQEDVQGEAPTFWRTFMAEEARRQGIIFIDLLPDLQRLTPVEREKLFIQEGELDAYYGAAGHYTAAGNRFVADLLAEKMRAMPELAGLFAEEEPRP